MSVFKLFVLDIGLMGAMADAPAESVIVADTLFKEYKGAFTELFVLTQFIPRPGMDGEQTFVCCWQLGIDWSFEI